MSWLKAGAGQPLLKPFVRALERAGSRRANLLRIVTYHDIDSTSRFDEQLSYLARKYHIVGLSDVREAFTGRRPLPPRAMMITFDDAYASFATLAWPLLRTAGLPVTLFVPTGFPDSQLSFWWDRLRHAVETTAASHAGPHPLRTPADRAWALKQLKNEVKRLPHDEGMQLVDRLEHSLLPSGAHVPCRVLGWSELRRLAGEGVTLAAHSRSHPRLDRVAPDRALREIRQSLEDLERETGAAPPALAYPDGGFDEGVETSAHEAGIELAFTTCRGTNDLTRCNPLRLRRIHVVPEEPLELFRARLAQSSVWLNRWHRFPETTLPRPPHSTAGGA